MELITEFKCLYMSPSGGIHKFFNIFITSLESVKDKEERYNNMKETLENLEIENLTSQMIISNIYLYSILNKIESNTYNNITVDIIKYETLWFCDTLCKYFDIDNGRSRNGLYSIIDRLNYSKTLVYSNKMLVYLEECKVIPEVKNYVKEYYKTDIIRKTKLLTIIFENYKRIYNKYLYVYSHDDLLNFLAEPYVLALCLFVVTS